MIPRSAWLVTALLWSPLAAAAEFPVVTSASISEDDTMSVVNLGTSFDASAVKTDISCGNSMLRVRFEGLEARVKGEPENLELSGLSPFHTVRLVSRTAPATVVQLVPRGSVTAACNRVSATVTKDGVVVLYRLTNRDQDHRISAAKNSKIMAKILAPTVGVAKPKEEPPAVKQAPPIEPAAPLPAVAEPEKATSPAAGTPLFRKDKDDKDSALAAATTKGSGTRLASGSGPNPLMAAIGCAIAGFLALAAFLIRRRGKQGNASLDSIEILSSKRLGTRQSLVLAAVGGKRFLLAVSDKSVSTLGEVQEDDALEQPRLDFPPMIESLPRRTAASPPLTNPRPAAPQANPRPTEPAERDPRELLRQLLSPSAAPEPVFERELRAAMGTTLPDEPSRPSRNLSDPSADGVSSNAAGLIAMARMRASMRRRPGTPAAQA